VRGARAAARSSVEGTCNRPVAYLFTCSNSIGEESTGKGRVTLGTKFTTLGGEHVYCVYSSSRHGVLVLNKMEIFLDPMNGVDEWSGINNLKYQFCLVIYVHALGDLTSCILLVHTPIFSAPTQLWFQIMLQVSHASNLPSYVRVHMKLNHLSLLQAVPFVL
jgi:hypothetical protein